MDRLRIGISGLGRGATLTVPAFAAHPRIEIVAAFDPSPDALAGFVGLHDAKACSEFGDLSGDPRIDLIYVASPHEHHAGQAIAAARAGKHVLVEKPMAVRLDEAARMVAAARAAGTRLIVGPSHGYDAPVELAESLIASAAYGQARMIHALAYTDFLHRPRRPAELDPALGGGVVYSQATHQIDLVRRIAGSKVRKVRAQCGSWDSDRAADGAFAALLFFENGACASLTYSGYGRYDSDALTGWIDEMGRPKSPAGKNPVKRLADQAAAKAARGYAGASRRASAPAPVHHEHFGFVVASCEEADLELSPDGVVVHDRDGARLHRAPLPPVLRYQVADALVQVILEGREPRFDGEWGLHSLACCHALVRSSAEDRDISVRELLDEISLQKESFS